MLDAKDDFRRVAVIDGSGRGAEVHLQRVYRDGRIEEIKWPNNWPTDYVSGEFLRSQGFAVVTA